jgi:hypothetical protein
LTRIRAGLVVESVLVVIGAVALALWVSWPVGIHLGDRILGNPGDSTGTIAGLWEYAHDGGFHLLGSHLDTFTGAPFGWRQGNGINVTDALVLYPAFLGAKVGQEIAAYNLVVLSGLVLSALAMYVLVRRLGMSSLVAAWGALVYTVFPWHIEKAQGHAPFVHLEGFPLLVLAGLAWYRRPDLVRALLLAGALAVLWTTAGYFGVIGAVALVTLLAVAAVMQRARLGAAGALRRSALGLAPSLFVMFVVYAIGRLGAGAVGIAAARNVHELWDYGARPWEFVVPSYRNILFGNDVGPWLVIRLHNSNFSETSLYVGWLTLLLALAWIVWAFVRRSTLSDERKFATVALTALVVVGVACSLPTPLPHTGIPMPARVIWQIAPEFRVPSRFIALVMTALIPIAAFSLEAVRSAVSHTQWLGRVAPLAAAALCVVAATVSYLELAFKPPPITTSLSSPPPEYAAVRAAPPGVLAEYPLASADQAVNSDYVFWQRVHRRRLLNGAPDGTLADAVRSTLVDPAAPGTAADLAALHVSTIVTRPTTYAYTGGTGDPRLGRGYKLLSSNADGARVWEVVARPAPAIAAFTTGFGGPETPPNQQTSRWLEAPSGRIEFVATEPGTYVARFVVNSYGPPRRVLLLGRASSAVAFTVGGLRTVALPIRLPRGHSAVSIETSPGIQLIPDGRLVSIYVRNWSFSPLLGRSRPPTKPLLASAEAP